MQRDTLTAIRQSIKLVFRGAYFLFLGCIKSQTISGVFVSSLSCVSRFGGSVGDRRRFRTPSGLPP